MVMKHISAFLFLVYLSLNTTLARAEHSAFFLQEWHGCAQGDLLSCRMAIALAEGGGNPLSSEDYQRLKTWAARAEELNIEKFRQERCEPMREEFEHNFSNCQAPGYDVTACEQALTYLCISDRDVERLATWEIEAGKFHEKERQERAEREAVERRKAAAAEALKHLDEIKRIEEQGKRDQEALAAREAEALASAKKEVVRDVSQQETVMPQEAVGHGEEAVSRTTLKLLGIVAVFLVAIATMVRFFSRRPTLAEKVIVSSLSGLVSSVILIAVGFNGDVKLAGFSLGLVGIYIVISIFG